MAKTAEVSYSKEDRQIQVVVPRGTKTADLPRIVELCCRPGLIPVRPCNTCTSGDHWLIREEVADAVQVNLDK